MERLKEDNLAITEREIDAGRSMGHASFVNDSLNKDFSRIREEQLRLQKEREERALIQNANNAYEREGCNNEVRKNTVRCLMRMYGDEIYERLAPALKRVFEDIKNELEDQFSGGSGATAA